jgi:hypothetical protein
MRTEIVEAEVLGTRLGVRNRISTYTRTRRYDYYDGRGHYAYSGNETTGSIFNSPTAVDLAVVSYGEKKLSFDMGWMIMPRQGDRVHVLVHHVGGGRVVDLYEDDKRMITVDGDFPFAEPTRTWGIVVTVLGTLILIWMGHGQWWSLQRAGAAGLAVFLLNHLHNLYVAKGLAFMRWRTARRLRRTLGPR